MRGDGRSRRVAVVPDVVVNPPPGARDRLAELAMGGWGVVALPPPGLPADISHPLVAAADDPGMRRFITALAASGRTVADLA